MAKAHALENGRFVIHMDIPPGNNDAGNTWKSAVVASLRNTTVLAEGVGDGKIPTQEKNQIDNGDIVEFTGSFFYDPTKTLAENDALMLAQMNQQGNEAMARLKEELRYFGRTVS